MFTTLAKRVAMALALLLPLSANAEPPSGVVMPVRASMPIVCDTADQIGEIGVAFMEGGMDAGIAVVVNYNGQINTQDAPVCVAGSFNGPLAFGEQILIGNADMNGMRRLWAVHVGFPSGSDYWVLWAEPVPEPSGWEV